MPTIGHHRSYSFGQKSIYFGRCVKRQFIRRFSSLTSQITNQKKQNALLLLPQIHNNTLNLNKSALSESIPKATVRSGIMLTTFNHNQDLSSIKSIPRAPPLPSNFNENISLEKLKSTEFSKGIKNHTSSITPSGTDLSQSMFIRPSQINESSSIIQMTKSKIYSNSIVKSNLRNRRRTPLTPDVLALTKLRRPEHIKSSIVQRIEELKQASLMNNQISNEKSSIISTEKNNDLLITCEYKNNEQERNWLKQQTNLNSSIQFLNTNNYLQLNNRLFIIRSIEFIDNKNLRFYAQEQQYEENFLTKYFKQINILTILIISILRLIENTLSNLSIPGIHIILNLIYVFILITIAIILLINQK
ncbi:unnamed protein product [Rotaria sordida]|uniref:Transmembrane protein n=1 Tax=Rotaria sordida TaxID=392033 RepID=A0A815TF98_9BILA|nr:unnamed protein product [Rotaria sordida]CAF3622970.1 unnamed protein product [Rotaria sordida]